MANKEVKKKLEEEIAKTKKVIEEYKELTQPIEPDEAIGRVSRMDAINNKAINEAALRQAETKLGKLEFMLSKLDSKDFGICQKCKQPIPIGRLLIRPESAYCVNCAK